MYLLFKMKNINVCHVFKNFKQISSEENVRNEIKKNSIEGKLKFAQSSIKEDCHRFYII